MTPIQTTTDYFRFCPGEEGVKISNAICRGRRRSHYPKCQGCQFNDDEKAIRNFGKPAAPLPDPESTNLSVSLAPIKTQPAVALEQLFRPSDISGTVPAPLSEDAAWRIGHATGQFLRSKLRGYDRVDPKTRSIIVGRDTRPHGETLERSLIEGIRSTGTDVVALGMIDTPQLFFAVNHTGACGGIQISAGHRGPAYNGFRICAAKAAPIGIETGLASIRDIAVRVPRHHSNLRSRLITRDFSEAYTEFVRDKLFAKTRLARPMRIVVDASNGAAGKWFPVLFKGIRNLRVTRLHFDHKGEFAHEPNPMRLKNTRELRKFVRDDEADFGVCFDSGAERAVFTDDRGRTVRPEFITALLARMFLERDPGATVVYDHRSSIITEEEIVRAGGVPIRQRIGGAYIKRTMSERDAVFGSDLSGRFYFRDNCYCESGILAFVHLMNLLLNTDRALSELIRPLQRYSSSGEVHFECDDTDRALHDITAAHGDAAIEQLDGVTFRYSDWWFNVLPAAADRRVRVTLEARSRKLVEQKLADLEPLLGRRA